jgi:glucuronate isomerase
LPQCKNLKKGFDQDRRSPMALLDDNRLLPHDVAGRSIARRLYDSVKEAPIISPHGHVDPAWFAKDEAFSNPTELFITPDHYVLRMLVSQGISLDQLGIRRKDGSARDTAVNPRAIWHIFAAHYHLFRATPSRMWLDHVFETLFELDLVLCAANADDYYDRISECLTQDAFRPRALFDRFNIEAIATTESALDPLASHRALALSDWDGRVITTYRPDAIINPNGADNGAFAAAIEALGEITGLPTTTWDGYLDAHRDRRAFFRSFGATATDHGHPTAFTTVLDKADAAALFNKALHGRINLQEAEQFRGHMLVEMARMSCEDGMVMQLHAGSYRNHAAGIFENFGTDMGFDIPMRTDFVNGLNPLLTEVGQHPGLRMILFTLDETTLSRELAPLAGAYPSVLLGPAWWFFDSPDGMRRYRDLTTETAGFYNTTGFNDDTRAFCSIPARHDVSRRVDAAYLASLVLSGRLNEQDAAEVAQDLAYGLAKKAYKL